MSMRLPTVLEKNLFIFNADRISKKIREVLWREYSAHKYALDPHSFLEWAEPFVSRINHIHPSADARLMTAEERDEMGVV